MQRSNGQNSLGNTYLKGCSAVFLLNEMRLSHSRNKRQCSVHQRALLPFDNHVACLL